MENLNINLEDDANVADRDHHLDFDMFDYIYSLVCTIDDYSTVLSPLGRPLKKFDNSMNGCQVYSDGKSGIVIGSYEKEDFNDLIEICKLYKFDYIGPDAKNTYSEKGIYYTLTIQVPMLMGSDYPVMLEDYFNDIGVPLENVMPKKWISYYRNKLAKLEKESNILANDLKVETIYQKHVTNAWRRGDIEILDHFQNLENELKEKNLSFKRNLLRRRFLEEFADIEDEEVEDSGELKEVELF